MDGDILLPVRHPAAATDGANLLHFQSSDGISGLGEGTDVCWVNFQFAAFSQAVNHAAVHPDVAFAFIHHAQEHIARRAQATEHFPAPISFALGHLGLVKVVHLVTNPLVQLAIGQWTVGGHLRQFLDQEVSHSAVLVFCGEVFVGFFPVAATGQQHILLAQVPTAGSAHGAGRCPAGGAVGGLGAQVRFTAPDLDDGVFDHTRPRPGVATVEDDGDVLSVLVQFVQ